MLSACNDEYNPEIYERTFDCKKVLSSFDPGVNWGIEDNLLEDFDIYDVKTNEYLPEIVLFFVTSYKELDKKVKENKKILFSLINT